MSKKRSPKSKEAFLPEKSITTTPSTYGHHNWVSAKQASIDFLNKIKETFDKDNDQTFKSFLQIMAKYGENQNNIEQVYQDVNTLFKNEPGLSIEFTKFLEKETNFEEKEDQSSEIDCLISKKPCFRNMGQNPYEQKLFQCEDDQFEFDMLSKQYESAIDHAERLVNDFKNSKSRENQIGLVEEYFSVHDIRCIEKLYGEHGYEMIDLFWSNPAVAVKNCILRRLKQKLEQLREKGSRKREIWADIYEQYHLKAIDHQSFYVERYRVLRKPNSSSESTVQNPESVNSNSDSNGKS
ncbi:Paired amphipathic helix protein Sin3-like 2 [Camellia lanceoleosa]|uniref:Paired amphipathic helix protein Sin3-like 2 n=1 Tax=Camellia lanceoleosa TaxID=1840588 RepID=A0ACC0H270_9ERIC|nr:Paired amphipathic helix protein Sin3-like 2 [Camellia lanceoleosa]